MTPPDASEQADEDPDGDDETFSIGTYVIDTEDPEPNLAVVINRPPMTCEEWVAYHTPETGEVTVAEDNPEYDATADVIVVAFYEELRAENPEWSPDDGPFDLGAAEFKPYAFPPGRLEVVDPDDWVEDAEPWDVAADDGAAADDESGTGSEARMARITPGGSSDDGTGPEPDATENEEPAEDGEDAAEDEEPEPEPPEIEGSFADLRDRLAENATVEVRRGEDGDPVLEVSKLGDSYEVRPDGSISGEGVLRARLDGLVEEYLS